MADGEEREEEGEEEGGRGEGQEEEALGTKELVRGRGGGAPLPLHCFAPCCGEEARADGTAIASRAASGGGRGSLKHGLREREDRRSRRVSVTETETASGVVE